MITKIEVTQVDIDIGTRMDCGFCPVARDCKRVFRDRLELVVSGVYVSVWNRDDTTAHTYESFPLSDDVTRKISDFDCKKEIQPFTFELDIPQELLR